MLSAVNDLKSTWAALWLLGWVCASSVSAQTLSDALASAWARHPAALALAARQDEAQAGLSLAQGMTPGPAAISVSQLNDQLNRHQGRQEWELEVSTPLWLPAQKSARLSEAAQALSAVEARSSAARWQLAGEVRDAWWAVALAREVCTLAVQRVDTAQALAKAVQRRYKAGDMARLDANLAQGELLAAEAERLDAEQALRQAEFGYRKLMGTDAPPVLPPEIPRTNDEGVMHPQLQALRTQTMLDGSRLAVLNASRRDAPELALRWSSQRSDAAEPYDRAVGIKLTVPLSSEARVQRDGAAVRAELAQSEAELAQSLTRIEEGVVLARSERDKAERQWAMAQQRSVLAADNRRLAQKSFDLGESDLPALMRARAADHEAQFWLKRQELARHAAQSRLYQAQGILP